MNGTNTLMIMWCAVDWLQLLENIWANSRQVFLFNSLTFYIQVFFVRQCRKQDNNLVNQ